ncbi:Uncharacterised protein [Vibrio cholerae]|uniref:Uncharacterized protein n=1 Tax=Vibrio cholerae TaxID=666 RepID=A0A655ZJY2_VIBCL|nr:hypothetical protein DN36_2218 [Vibrio cholerae]CSB57139.1 Uncharacterised protein [Vibrio cholerae]CSB61872.1 Uncharacterised protein [Vibrio cholerae]CSC43833.1 Uncharacterised protein [Vibrio cholerae]CSC49373.1 Uncharacterised protein [Vibrio cholerae]
MRCDTTSGSQLKLAAPTPSKIPATGKTDTGSISALPTFCRFAKAFLNMFMLLIKLLELLGLTAYPRSLNVSTQ